MPPYAGATTHEDESSSSDDLLLNPLTNVKGEFFDNYMSSLCVIEEQPKKATTKLNKVLDFHPCSIHTTKMNSLSSALFKVRICAESGEEVYKYRNGGYTKEEIVVVDGFDLESNGGNGVSVLQKRYLSPFGVQRRKDRLAHNETLGYGAVMASLLERFEAIEQTAIEQRVAKRIADEARLELQAEWVGNLQASAAEARALDDARLQTRAKKLLRGAWNQTKRWTSKNKYNKKVADEDRGTWKSTIDPRLNTTYYYHTKTRQTTWIPPKGFFEQN